MRTYLLLAGAALILAAGAPAVLHGSGDPFGPPYDQCTYLFPKSGSTLVTEGPGGAAGKLEYFEDPDTGKFCFSFKAQNLDTVDNPPLDLSGVTPYALVATRADNGVNLVVLGLTEVVDDVCTSIGEVFVRAETGDFKLEIKDAAIKEGDEFHVSFYCAGEEAFSGDFTAGEDGELLVWAAAKVNFDCKEPSVVITGTSLDAYSGFCLGDLAD